jgi:hypothetical protein
VTTRLATLLALVPSIAAAHPGHGHTDPDSWRHYLTEPIHIAALAGVAALAIGIGSAWRRARRRRSGKS